MNKTKIDWATMSWNPVTGCRHGCPYCYARRTATRFNAGLEDPAPLAGGLHMLPEKIKATPYPYGFEPTLHRYRLGQPQNTKEPQTVFVCSMADLFGRWVPTSWIVEVLDACRKAPQHRYLFLTKNPARYLELDHLALLPHGEHGRGGNVRHAGCEHQQLLEHGAAAGAGGHGRGGGFTGVGDPGRRNRQPTGQGDARPRVGGQHRGILRGERDPCVLQGKSAEVFPGSPCLCFPLGGVSHAER